MTDETKKKPTATIISLAMAGFAAVTAVGDGIRSWNERQHDLQLAAQAEQNRIEVDKSIQRELKKTVGDLYSRIDDLEGQVEAHDRELFELRVEVNAHQRLLEMRTNVTRTDREQVMLEALVDEYGGPTSVKIDAGKKPEAIVKEEAAKHAKRVSAPAPRFDFVEPEQQYQLPAK